MAHTYVISIFHIVFHTKSKANYILPQDLDRVYQYIGGIIKHLNGTQIAIGGMPDHVHLLASVPKTMALADFVRTVKAESSRWIKDLDFHFYSRFAWQEGYAAFSVSSSAVPNVINYIKNQQEHHRVKTFKEEMIAIYDANGIKYDERYL